MSLNDETNTVHAVATTSALVAPKRKRVILRSLVDLRSSVALRNRLRASDASEATVAATTSTVDTSATSAPASPAKRQKKLQP